MEIDDNVRWTDDSGMTRTGILLQFVNKVIQTREQLRTIAPLYRNDTVGMVWCESENKYYEVYYTKLQKV